MNSISYPRSKREECDDDEYWDPEFEFSDDPNFGHFYMSYCGGWGDAAESPG